LQIDAQSVDLAKEHENSVQPTYEPRFGDKYLGYLAREEGRYGSISLYDDYGEWKVVTARCWTGSWHWSSFGLRLRARVGDNPRSLFSLFFFKRVIVACPLKRGHIPFTQIDRNQVKLGVNCPREWVIARGELLETYLAPEHVVHHTPGKGVD
jgi:hypothetical protein